MNYQEFQQRVEAIKTLLGAIDIPADEKHVGVVAQVHYLLNQMRDECVSCIRQEQMAAKESVAETAE